ncbi:MAG: DNA gyrase inhibitor YacG [Gammaproteobacteria bacterium]|nr:DNA gyrase inhibitor YacG [Gammaproteobacteria bacterium]
MNKQFVKCPTCGKEVEWSDESQWRPFCCARCRLIDLGEWVDGNRSIPTEETPFSDDMDND